MPEINLDELVPEDIAFVRHGKRYVVDGDLDVDTSLKLVGLFMTAAEAEASGDVDAISASNNALKEYLLELFRIRDPALESIPFGVQSLREVVGQLLVAVGLQIVDDDKVVDPPKPRPKRAPPRSRRSTGSRK